MPALLDRLRLGHGGVSVEGTPRRLSVIVHQLAARQSNSAERVRGPPVKAAYTADTGAATPALLGFCKKNGVTGAWRAAGGPAQAGWAQAETSALAAGGSGCLAGPCACPAPAHRQTCPLPMPDCS